MAVELIRLTDNQNTGINQHEQTRDREGNGNTAVLGFSETLQAGDVLLYVHGAENSNNGTTTQMPAPGTGNTHPSSYSIATTSTGTHPTWVDFGYQRGGENSGNVTNRNNAGAFACVIGSGDTTSGIEVTLTYDDAADVQRRNHQIFCLRGVDTSNFSTLAAISRTAAFTEDELSFHKWSKPTDSNYNATTITNDFMALFVSSVRQNAQVVFTNTATGGNNDFTASDTLIEATMPNDASGSAPASWDAFDAFGTGNTATRAAYSYGLAFRFWLYFKTYSSFSGFDVGSSTNFYGQHHDNANDHNGGASLLLLFPAEVAASIDYQVLMDGTTGANITNVPAESITASDAGVLDPGLTGTDTLSQSDAIEFEAGVVGQDTITASDAGVLDPGVILPGETITATDAGVLDPGVTGTDTITASDAADLDPGVVGQDTITQSDAIEFEAGVVGKDTLTVFELPRDNENETQLETVSLSDSIALELNVLLPTDTITATDAGVLDPGVVGQDTITASDAEVLDPGVVGQDSLTASDAGELDPGVVGTDTLTATDAADLDPGVVGTDTITATDAEVLDLGVVAQELVQATTDSDPILDIGVELPGETVTATEGTPLIEITILVTESETISASDSATFEASVVLPGETITIEEEPADTEGEVAQETVSLSDQIVLEINVDLSGETITATDATELDPGVVGTDTLSQSDAVEFEAGVVGADTITATDSETLEASVILPGETVTATEGTPVIETGLLVSESETISASDSATLDPGVVGEDTITATDSETLDPSVVLPGETITIQEEPADTEGEVAQETVSLSDQIVIDLGVVGQEAITASDTAELETGVVGEDTLTQSDAVEFEAAILFDSETVTVTEQTDVVESIGDITEEEQVSVTEVFSISWNGTLQESATITETPALSFGIEVSETLTVTEQTTEGEVEVGEESVSVVESFSFEITKTLDETATISETNLRSPITAEETLSVSEQTEVDVDVTAIQDAVIKGKNRTISVNGESGTISIRGVSRSISLKGYNKWQ